MNPQVREYLPLLSLIATVIVVILGVFYRNHHLDVRIGELRSHMDSRFKSMDKRFQEHLRRVEEIMDAWLRRIEQDLHLK
jgi:hypothetical protein